MKACVRRTPPVLIMRTARIGLVVVLLPTPPSEGQRPAGAPSTARRADAWQVTVSRSEMTDQPSLTLQLDALNLVAGPVGNVRPTMYIRCSEQELAVVVTTGSVLDADSYEQTRLRIRWGSDTAVEAWCTRSSSDSAAFAPGPWAFIGQLIAAPDVRIEFRPFAALPRVARFNARGLDRHIAKLKAACPPPPPDDSTAGIMPPQGEPFLEAILDEKPVVLSGPQAVYPEYLQKAGIEGRAIVQAIIDTTGRVEPSSIKIMQSPDTGFDRSAKEYVLKALFRPGRLRGRPVRALIALPVDFRLNA